MPRAKHATRSAPRKPAARRKTAGKPAVRKPAVRGASRQRLLDAGLELAQTARLERLTVAGVCARAGLKAATFHRQFASERAFHVELMQLLYGGVRRSIAKLTYNMPAGLPRMKLAIEAFLAANLARPALRQMALELRSDPAGAEVIRRQVLGFMMMMELELKSIGWPRPVPSARLLTAGIVETTLAEYEAGKALPAFRSTLFDYLDAHA